MSARNLVFTLALLTVCTEAAVAADNGISAQEAYKRLRLTGELTSVTVADPFDFSELGEPPDSAPQPGGYRVRRVEFAGPVRLSGTELPYDVRIDGSNFRDEVRLQQCSLQTFAVRNSVWSRDLVVENCTFNGFSPFDGNEFQSDLKFHLVSFFRSPNFRDAVFRGRTEFLECDFGKGDPPAKSTSFSNAVFEGPTLFNNSRFHTKAKFQSVVFEEDASFVNTRMEADAAFRNVHFKGDAEFRFCRIATADFGNRNNLTLFAKRADFRSCTMETALFDYVELRGETSFVNARFGLGGASFRNANLGNKRTDFDGVTSAGPIVFSNAHMPALRFYWREVREPVLDGDPDAKVLAALHARLKDQGDTEGALDASHHLAKRKFAENVGVPLPSLTQQPSEFLDAIGRRLVAYGEWVLWGWPTGYGTKLGRILLLALACWLIAALPVASTRRLLARVPSSPETDSDASKPRESRSYEPLASEERPEELRFPDAFPARLTMALKFTFRLLFKVGPKDIRPVASASATSRRVTWKVYLASLWYLGSGLLVLIALTLANTSPMIDRLIGELFP
ncbi:MAG: pentapeptide repeat-containing protein [Pseudomonadota bacterium]|nr:pentapeptide repeat-containing protein [Pseudomonadota bacterium]